MINNEITVVINTFKSEDKIHNCLDSISSNFKVIIIENSNNLIFKNKIQEKYPNVECFLSGENLGYAKGNNLGLSKVKSKYALILNPDAVLEKNTLERLLDSAQHLEDFSIIGPAKQDEYSTIDIDDNKKDIFQCVYIIK